MLSSSAHLSPQFHAEAHRTLSAAESRPHRRGGGRYARGEVEENGSEALGPPVFAVFRANAGVGRDDLFHRLPRFESSYRIPPASAGEPSDACASRLLPTITCMAATSSAERQRITLPCVWSLCGSMQKPPDSGRRSTMSVAGLDPKLSCHSVWPFASLSCATPTKPLRDDENREVAYIA